MGFMHTFASTTNQRKSRSRECHQLHNSARPDCSHILTAPVFSLPDTCRVRIQMKDKFGNVVKDEHGQPLPPRTFFRSPEPAKKADFVRSIRSRFPKHADKILNHLRDKANELLNYTHKSSGYSEVRVLWDTELDKEMTNVQKVALLLQLTGELAKDGTKELKKKVKEVPGFEGSC